jgi:hypothetical protein
VAASRFPADQRRRQNRQAGAKAGAWLSVVAGTIIKAIRDGNLRYQENYAHGNPYFRLLRGEVTALAKEVHGEHALELKVTEYEIKRITIDINSHKRKISALERKKKLALERSDFING